MQVFIQTSLAALSAKRSPREIVQQIKIKLIKEEIEQARHSQA